MESGTAIARDLANGYRVVAEGKIPILGTDGCHASYEDGTVVRAEANRLTISYAGTGTLTIALTAGGNIEPDEQCTLLGLCIEWAGKAVTLLTSDDIYFADGSYVQTDGNLVLCAMMGGGMLQFGRTQLATPSRA